MKTITNIIYSAIALFAFGYLALSPKAQAVSPPPDGGYPNFTTAEGQNALLSLTTGTGNTAVGWFALRSDTTASYNTAVGTGTLLANTDGFDNTAIGTGALLSNTVGNDNTAVGAFALFYNLGGTLTIGSQNTAVGNGALFSNTTGGANTAIGNGALATNDASFNTAVGDRALVANFADSNTAIGYSALSGNTGGTSNTALGYLAGSNLTTGDNNVYIGAGINGLAGESDACRIASIFGQTSASGIPVLINSGHKLGTMPSSRRFKEAIRPMDKASEALLALNPVTFRYKKEIDPQRTSQFGLVAEDVEKVSPDLVVRDKEGKPYSVRYDQVNAMLLNEFLKEHKAFLEEQCKVQKQEATIAELKSGMKALAETLKEQAGQIQRVSAQMELSRPVQPVARISK